jgi:hypothetical protein
VSYLPNAPNQVVRCSIEKWEYHVVKEFLLEKLEQSAASA